MCDAQSSLVPFIANAVHQRWHDVLEKDGRSVLRDGAPKHTIETRAVERTRALNGDVDSLGVFSRVRRFAGYRFSGRARRLVLGHETFELGCGNAGDLADAASMLRGQGEQAKPGDIGIGIEALAARGAGWLNRRIAPLPHTEDVAGETCTLGHNGDWVPGNQPADGFIEFHGHGHNLRAVHILSRDIPWTNP